MIIGASISGLASACCLQKKGIGYIIIEKQSQVAAPWRNHYDRLHLHTNKSLSNLPYKKFSKASPTYPSRQQVVEYLDEYRTEFSIDPLFNTEATSVAKEGDYWITKTSEDTFKSKHVIIATGPYGKPKEMNFKGMETFPGKLMHSCNYKSGKDFKGQRVLVIGFGNSACEIAIDLFEQGAMPLMSVRSPVNVIPMDVFGISILKLSLLMSKLPARLADTINAPLMRLLIGDITKLGLKKMEYGPFEQIKKEGTIPLLDIGTIRHIRQGHIKVHGGVDHISGNTVHFVDGSDVDVDAIIAATGYDHEGAGLIHVDLGRFEDLKQRTNNQQYFGKDGLYFCGFYVGPTGLIREIGIDAKKIAGDIEMKSQV